MRNIYQYQNSERRAHPRKQANFLKQLASASPNESFLVSIAILVNEDIFSVAIIKTSFSVI